MKMKKKMTMIIVGIINMMALMRKYMVSINGDVTEISNGVLPKILSDNESLVNNNIKSLIIDIDYHSQENNALLVTKGLLVEI